MSAYGVMPLPQERRLRSTLYVQPARVRDIDGYAITVSVDPWGRVEIGHSATALSVRLNREQAEAFAQLFVRACWEAGEVSP